MPVFSAGAGVVTPQGFRPEPRTLAFYGPIMQVQIEVPQALARVLIERGESVPSPVEGVALVDTGASFTAVSESAMQTLGIAPIDVAGNIGTAGGVAQRNIYPARVTFPGSDLPTIEFNRMISVDLAGQIVPLPVGRPVLLLFGRDLLSRFVLVYNGPGASWSLSG